MSIEGTANTEYASLSGKIRTFVVDKTLTISGACADAKATGEKFEGLLDEAVVAAEEVAEKVINDKVDPAVADAVTTAMNGLEAELKDLINGKAVVATGTYDGCGDTSIAPCINLDFDLIAVEIFELVTDKYHQGDDTSYTAPVAFKSKLRLVRPFEYANVYMHKASGENGASGQLTYDAGLRVSVHWDSCYVEWYTEEYKADNGGDAPKYDIWLDMQADVAGKTYYYVAIGKEA